MSEEMVQVKKDSLTLERIALAGICALLSWNVYTTNALTIQQAVAQAQLDAIKTELSTQNGRYASNGEYLVLKAEVDAMEARFTNWVSRLGDRVNDVERAVERGEARESTDDR